MATDALTMASRKTASEYREKHGSGLDAILAAVKDYYERIRELETDININVDGGTPKSTDLLLVKGGTPFTTDYDKYIAGTSHTI